MQKTELTTLVAVILLFAFIAVFTSGVLDRPHITYRRDVCKNQLKMIGLALYNYHDKFGCFPPAYVTDQRGNRMHSWRTLLLPFLDNQGLYDKYRLDEPWNGPNNSKLHSEKINLFCCPSGHSANVSYLAVIGPHTAWPGASSRKLSEVRDQHDTTIMVVEQMNSGIHWMEPRDLDVEHMNLQVNSSRGNGISSPHVETDHYLRAYDYSYAWALMVDGSTKRIRQGTQPQIIKAMLTVDGGEAMPK